MLSVNSMTELSYRLTVFLLVIGLFFSSCENKAKDNSVNTPRHQIPEEGKNIVSLLSEGAKLKGRLTAPYMLRFQRADSPYAEFPKTLHVDFYNASKVIESQLDALYGKYLQAQNKVYLRDSVVVKNILKGDTVHCQELWWDQQTERFYTDKPVRIYTKDKVLFGNGMEADQNFQWYHIIHLTGTVLTSQNAMPK
jgi:lipopolysaccharide export system protein LptC